MGRIRPEPGRPVDLEAAELLLSMQMNPSPGYRSRLEDWTLDAIGAWAKGWWTTCDPRQWPPDRDD